jgi:hypothetical protein
MEMTWGPDNPARLPVATKVEYTTVNGAKILGVVVSEGEPMEPGYVVVKVTSRNNPSYPHGMVYTASIAFLRVR